MHAKIPAIFNWSGGKDSALALYRILQEDKYQVTSLLTTINRDTRRSSMHGIPIELLHRQADSIGLPLQVIELPSTCSMQEYETAMNHVVSHFQNQGISHFIFGIFALKRCDHTEKNSSHHWVLRLLNHYGERIQKRLPKNF